MRIPGGTKGMHDISSSVRTFLPAARCGGSPDALGSRGVGRSAMKIGGEATPDTGANP
jgi:hypothetical protein